MNLNTSNGNNGTRIGKSGVSQKFFQQHHDDHEKTETHRLEDVNAEQMIREQREAERLKKLADVRRKWEEMLRKEEERLKLADVRRKREEVLCKEDEHLRQEEVLCKEAERLKQEKVLRKKEEEHWKQEEQRKQEEMLHEKEEEHQRQEESAVEDQDIEDDDKPKPKKIPRINLIVRGKTTTGRKRVSLVYFHSLY